jgi:hypothetical protein
MISDEGLAIQLQLAGEGKTLRLGIGEYQLERQLTRMSECRRDVES